MPLLQVKNLTTTFTVDAGILRAVDGVSFCVEPGEICGIVGESGCGKSALCLSLLRLLPSPPATVHAQQACFEGVDLLGCDQKKIESIRGRHIGMVFQDPGSALNPYHTIAAQVVEALRAHQRLPRTAAHEQAAAMLNEVGIDDFNRCLKAYPHHFSGGMRQRVLIAMALIARPSLLIADEITTGLDVCVQVQIAALLLKLKRDRGLSAIFVTHDLGVAAGLCDKIMVMYAGKVVESSPVTALFKSPAHPYTRALLSCLPSHAPSGRLLPAIVGVPPDCILPVVGCAFAPRCTYAQPACVSTPGVLCDYADGRQSACRRVTAGELFL